MARTAKIKNGLHANAGRLVLGLLAVVLLASSTVSDKIQKLIDDSTAERARVTGAHDDHETIRQALLRRIALNVDAVRHLSAKELVMVFGEPSLKRAEGKTISWHFTSPDCALDIYFQEGKKSPAYAEYRVRGEIEESGLVEGRTLDHKDCLKSLYANAR